MAISVVNGYFCFNSCQAALASKGKNPHATNAGNSDADAAAAAGLSPPDNPAVILGGKLSATSSSNATGSNATGSNATAPSATTPSATTPNATTPNAGGAKAASPANTVDLLV